MKKPKIPHLKHKDLVKETEEIWKLCVKARAGWKSEISGGTSGLSPHHILEKPNYPLRFLLENGIACTNGEHQDAHSIARRERFEERVKRLRGADIYDKLRMVKNMPTGKTDLYATRFYLFGKLKEFIKKNGVSGASEYNLKLLVKYLGEPEVV